MKLFKNIAAALAVTLVLFAGCKNPAEDVQIIVNTDIFKSPVLIQFVNAKADVEGPQSFDVEITGPGASLVRTTTGGKSFKVAGGLLNLLLDRSANPSVASPIKFTVVANAAGYAPTYQDVTVTSATDPIILKVAMNQYANPAANTGAVVATRATTNGTAASDLTFTTATNANMAQKTAVTVPSGTTFLDAAGASVGGDQVEARIVHYSAEGAPWMPGGSFASNAIGANGQPIVGGMGFNVAGAVSIDMFFGSKEVRSFSKPVTVDIEVDNTMVNPTTNQPIQENETIPMWSLNDQTGQWKNEGNATFIKNTTGNLVARLQITHLSGWGVFYDALYCESAKIIVNRPASNLQLEDFYIYYAGRSWGFSMTKDETSKTLTLPLTPNQGGLLIAKAINGTYTSNELMAAQRSICGVTRTFTFVAQQNLVKIDVDVKLRCIGKDLLTGVNTFVTVTPVGRPSSEAMILNLVNGKASGTAVNGVTYKLVAAVDGVTYSSQFTVEKKNGIFSGGGLTGSTTYDATTNTVMIEGMVAKNCD